MPRVVALNLASSKRGVREGMSLAEAGSLLDGAEPFVAPLDAAADLAELRRLAVECGRFGPVVGVEEGDRPESVLADVAGCAHFFGDESRLMREAVEFLEGRGYTVRAGLADTVGLAWAASRTAGRRATLVHPGDGELWIANKAVAVLRLDAKTLDLLGTLGLSSVGDVLSLPRSELPSRFGPLLLRRLDQALGLTVEAIEPVRPSVPLAVRWSSETPLTNRPAVSAVLGRLLGRLVDRLLPWEGITSVECRFNAEPSLAVGVAFPTRSVDRLIGLVSLALDRDPLPRETGRVVVSAETIRLPPPDRTSLFGDRTSGEREREFRRLVERLASRLGPNAVLRPAPAGGHLPEQSAKFLPATTAGPTAPGRRTRNISAVASRPLLLLPGPLRVGVLAVYPDGPPHRVVMQGRTRTLILALGPERYETGWPDGPEAQRDYWRCETEDAERLWLYRCRRSGDWFLHGLFG